eukprot:TRINITY_DN13961_c0_g1_i1.p1 TRINITY_DN13961_c0_g1~~TRINITY_DN13961_c0_g1_i1.p1  ORF type:complete len:458 (+),score=73.76 TRINITY_DN13961_c0_g1_i1:59-1432(+)
MFAKNGSIQIISEDKVPTQKTTLRNRKEVDVKEIAMKQIFAEPNTVDEISSADSRDRVRQIKRFILAEEDRVRKERPWLNYQDLIGAIFFVGSIAMIIGIAGAYLSGALAWYFVIPLIGLPISILHELEHDLIHNLYFKGHKRVQDVMFALIWFFKWHGNPWWRRDMHHWHHRVSGQKNDIEERLIGLGMDMDWKRLGVATHPLGFLNDVKVIKSEAPKNFDIAYMNRGSMPTAMVLIAFLKVFPWIFAAKLLVPTVWWDTVGLEAVFVPVRDFMVILAFPLFLRQSCLVAMSTACHYFGDIPERNCYYQNQILDHWLLTPLQIYCWWFGSTHIIHHYIPNQPFYLRPFIEKNVHAKMQTLGVRKNDWGVVRRANRFNRNPADKAAENLSAIIWFPLVFLASFFYCFFWDIVVFKSGLKVVYYFFSYPIRCRTQSYKNRIAKRTEQEKDFEGVPNVK